MEVYLYKKSGFIIMSNYYLKSFKEKLNELPEDRKNLIIEYGEKLYEQYKKELFQIENTPKVSIHDLFKFSDLGSIHVILNDSHNEYLQIVNQINERDIIEWVNPLNECHLDGIETPQQQIDRVERYYKLAIDGCNIVIRTNSYFVLNKLYILSRKCGINLCIYVLNKVDDIWQIHNLEDGIPDNFIINASIDLYHEELNL